MPAGRRQAVAVAERGRAVGFCATVLEEVRTYRRRAWDGDCCCLSSEEVLAPAQ